MHRPQIYGPRTLISSPIVCACIGPKQQHNLFKGRFNPDSRKFVFSRVIDVWNSLDEDIIACDLLNGFKNTIYKFLKDQEFV